jgi:hypothetical protein
MEVNSAEQPKEILDMDSGEFVKNPEFKAPQQEQEEEEEEEEQEKPDPKSKKKDEEEEESETEKEEEEEEEESENEEEDNEEEEEEEESEEEKDDKNVVSIDDYIAQTYGEKYQVKTEADLTKLIDNALDVMDELEKTKTERDALKADSGKIKFDDAAQESAFNFVKKYDPSLQGEALQTFAKLAGMDIDKADPVMLLEEKFVHDHPEWTRAESLRMFKKEASKKYDQVAREKFDGTDEEYEEDKLDREIVKKGDVAKAKTYLTDLKSKHKPAEKPQPKQNELVTKAIEQNVPKFTSFVESKKDVVFGKGEHKFNFVLDADKKKAIASAMKEWANSPTSYNDKGQLEGVDNEEQMLKVVVATLYPDELVQFAFDLANSKTKIARAEEIEGQKVKKRKPLGSGEVVGGDLDSEALKLIKQRKKAA